MCRPVYKYIRHGFVVNASVAVMSDFSSQCVESVIWAIALLEIGRAYIYIYIAWPLF